MPRPTRLELRQQRLSAAMMALVFAGTIAYGWLVHQQMPAFAAQRLKQEATLARLHAELAREERATALEALEKELAPLASQLNRSDPWSVIQPDLRALVPAGVKLTTVTVEPPKITLSGQATGPEQVQALLQALADSPRFGQPVLLFGAVQPDDLSFSLTSELAGREVAR